MPGKVYETEDVNDLKTYLKQGTIQRLRWRLEKDGKLVRGAETLDISRIGGSPAWISGLEDGIYTAIVHTFRRDIEIRRGDFLSASLTGAGPTGTRLVRSLLSEEAGVAPNCRAKVRDWQLGVLQNRFGADGAAEMLIGVENEAGRDPAGGTLKQIKPDFCWFEVKPQKIARPSLLRWGNMERYSAYVARLHLPEWPDVNGERAAPELEAWWSANGEPTIQRSVPFGSAVDRNELRKPVQVDAEGKERRGEGREREQQR